MHSITKLSKVNIVVSHINLGIGYNAMLNKLHIAQWIKSLSLRICLYDKNHQELKHFS